MISRLISQILIKAVPTLSLPQVSAKSSKSLLHIGQGSTQLCLHGEIHLQQSGKNQISVQSNHPSTPLLREWTEQKLLWPLDTGMPRCSSRSRSQYQFVLQGLDAGDVGELLAAHHGVHVLHLAAQAAHCHRVEIGIPDPQGGLEGTKPTLTLLPRSSGGLFSQIRRKFTVMARRTAEFFLSNHTWTTLMPSSSTRTEWGNRKKTPRPESSRQSSTESRT